LPRWFKIRLQNDYYGCGCFADWRCQIASFIQFGMNNFFGSKPVPHSLRGGSYLFSRTGHFIPLNVFVPAHVFRAALRSFQR
jgi:hypothetical protein